MRELERLSPSLRAASADADLAIVGAGRLGTALAAALRRGGIGVSGPLTRGQPLPDPLPPAVLLCVPDAAIGSVAAGVPAGPLLGHCSGATGLLPLGARPAFSLHPLMTVPAGDDGRRLAGAGAAIDGTTAAALETARALACAAGMDPFRVDERDRATYHAAASIASNFLVTLEAAAERLGADAGVSRAQLLPLVRATVETWATLGPRDALTGPVARGDAATVARQRDAVAQRAPELLPLFDALVNQTRRLAAAEALAC